MSLPAVQESVFPEETTFRKMDTGDQNWVLYRALKAVLVRETKRDAWIRASAIGTWTLALTVIAAFLARL